MEDTIAAQMLQSVATMTTAPLRPATAVMPQQDHVSSSGAPLHQLFSQLQLEKEDLCGEKLSCLPTSAARAGCPRGPGGRSSRSTGPELAQFAPMMVVIRARDNLELSEELVVSAPKESGGCGGG